ncbi:zinc finger, CCHC-type containing protein [Tanacetum coccineum]|uniref:Zinc finger, CCHC-type containing protein n=1 Tax=Tanacetum coccineum TaxID=301880 RepID=A0ABQ5GI68_9ASTR
MHKYAVSSLLDTVYALSEQYLEISSFNLQNAKSVVYVLNTPIPEDGENATMEQIRRNKWEKTTMFAEAKYMAKDASSKKFLDSDKPKGNNVVGPSVVNKVEHNKSTRMMMLRGNESTALVHGCGCVDLRFSFGKIISLFNVLHVPNIRKSLVSSTFMSTSKLNDSIIWHARLGHVHFKMMQDMSNDGLVPSFDMDIEKYEALDKFKVFKTEFKLQQGALIKRFRADRGGEYMDTLYFYYVSIIYETTAPYTPQQNGISKRKNKVLKEMVNSMLSYSGLSQGFWGEAMLTACYLVNRVPNKRNRITPYELWTKKKPSLNYLKVWGCRAVVRLPDPKLKTLGESGIECIFVSNEVPSGVTKEVTDEGLVQQPEPEPELRKSKRNRTPKNFGLEFQLYLIKGTRDEVSDQYSYYFNGEDDPKTFNEVMKSQDVAFWKEATNDEMDFIMAITFGCWLIYFQVANLLVANGSSKEN